MSAQAKLRSASVSGNNFRVVTSLRMWRATRNTAVGGDPRCRVDRAGTLTVFLPKRIAQEMSRQRFDPDGTAPERSAISGRRGTDNPRTRSPAPPVFTRCRNHGASIDVVATVCHLGLQLYDIAHPFTVCPVATSRVQRFLHWRHLPAPSKAGGRIQMKLFLASPIRQSNADYAVLTHAEDYYLKGMERHALNSSSVGMQPTSWPCPIKAPGEIVGGRLRDVKGLTVDEPALRGHLSRQRHRIVRGSEFCIRGLVINLRCSMTIKNVIFDW